MLSAAFLPGSDCQPKWVTGTCWLGFWVLPQHHDQPPQTWSVFWPSAQYAYRICRSTISTVCWALPCDDHACSHAGPECHASLGKAVHIESFLHVASPARHTRMLKFAMQAAAAVSRRSCHCVDEGPPGNEPSAHLRLTLRAAVLC